MFRAAALIGLLAAPAMAEPSQEFQQAGAALFAAGTCLASFGDEQLFDRAYDRFAEAYAAESQADMNGVSLEKARTMAIENAEAEPENFAVQMICSALRKEFL